MLTEIDVRATIRDKLGEDMEDYLILGACNPPLAHQALGSDRTIGLLLPCNVVIRAGDQGTIVEALDLRALADIAGQPALTAVATQAATRIQAARKHSKMTGHLGDRGVASRDRPCADTRRPDMAPGPSGCCSRCFGFKLPGATRIRG